MMLARIAYGALFTVLLPLLLTLWARRLDGLLRLPAPPLTTWGPGVLLAGVVCMSAGTAALWRHGRGLPMSAFPPERLVTEGVYRWFANPLYVGAGLVAFGVGLTTHSGATVWIVAPVLCTMAVAWVLGFEADHTRRLFGVLPKPAMHLPDDADRAPTAGERVAVYVRVLVPWLLAFQLTEWLGVPRDAIAVWRLPGERDWPVVPWTEAMYLLPYVLVPAAPLVAHRARDLRRFAHDGLLATLLIIPWYLLVPLAVTAKAVPAGTMWSPLLAWERWGDAPVTALPAFHIVWMLIAARLLGATWPRWRAVWAVVSVAVAISCITTGMHAVLDVVAGVVTWMMVQRAPSLWRALCRLAERAANSWTEWRIGRVRFINHGLYAASGAAGGVLLATVIAGPSSFPWLVAATVASILGAALWAQLVEGSSQLLRPFGYFGAVIGTLATTGVALAAGQDGWLLLAAVCTGGGITVAFGRVRCLVQGCCHGRLVNAPWGIRYQHPRSRVVRLSELGGTPVHPSPLYSALWTLLSTIVLLRCWALAAPVTFIAGIAFLLAGLGRFVEEHFRGEPQTVVWAGLRLYQWLAIALVIVGAALTCIRGRPAPVWSWPPAGVWPVLLLLFVFTYAAYGLDFPESTRRFSRLT